MSWFDLIITNPMVNILLFIYQILFHNFGLAIIMFTVLIRLVLYPLTVKQLKGTQAMQDLNSSKEWQEIQKKHKGDREALSREQMRLYQEMGVNPLASCLPTLLQFPIMIGLYQAIMRCLAVTPNQLLDLSKHIYSFIKAPALIPLNNIFLWMDLGKPERLYIFGIAIPVLAIVVVITQYISGKIMQPPSTNPNDQSAQMTQTMNLTMPLFMGYIAYVYNAGLALYFVTSNILYIVQYAMMGRVNWANVLPKALLPKKLQDSSSSNSKSLPEPKPAKKSSSSSKSTKASKQSQNSK
jgi:YidC/Oxa1 family membrane protein insertase